MQVNILGRDPKTGFARAGEDNVGVQYGLAALNSGVISPDEFIKLRYANAGAFAQMRYAMTPRIVLTLGGRGLRDASVSLFSWAGRAGRQRRMPRRCTISR